MLHRTVDGVDDFLPLDVNGFTVPDDLEGIRICDPVSGGKGQQVFLAICHALDVLPQNDISRSCLEIGPVLTIGRLNTTTGIAMNVYLMRRVRSCPAGNAAVADIAIGRRIKPRDIFERAILDEVHNLGLAVGAIAEQNVITSVAADVIIAGAPVDQIVTSPALDGVVATPAEKGIIAGCADDGVVGACGTGFTAAVCSGAGIAPG